jgi:hypothetical protein
LSCLFFVALDIIEGYKVRKTGKRFGPLAEAGHERPCRSHEAEIEALARYAGLSAW